MANEVPKVRADLGGAGQPAGKRYTNRGGCSIVIGDRSVAPGDSFEAELSPDFKAFLLRAGFIDPDPPIFLGGYDVVISPPVADEEKR